MELRKSRKINPVVRTVEGSSVGHSKSREINPVVRVYLCMCVCV